MVVLFDLVMVLVALRLFVLRFVALFWLWLVSCLVVGRWFRVVR